MKKWLISYTNGTDGIRYDILIFASTKTLAINQAWRSVLACRPYQFTAVEK